jgi:hypothetical protein
MKLAAFEPSATGRRRQDPHAAHQSRRASLGLHPRRRQAHCDRRLGRLVSFQTSARRGAVKLTLIAGSGCMPSRSCAGSASCRITARASRHWHSLGSQVQALLPTALRTQTRATAKKTRMRWDRWRITAHAASRWQQAARRAASPCGTYRCSQYDASFCANRRSDAML